MRGLEVTSSYTADAIQFLSVLTGQDFYVRHHKEPFAAWHPRLSADAVSALAEVGGLLTSPYLGPTVILPLSAVPGFASLPPADLLADPDLTESHFRKTPYFNVPPVEQVEFSLKHRRVSLLLADIVRELESLGFRQYWKSERAPAIAAAADDLQRTIAPVDFDLARAAADLLGPRPGASPSATSDPEPITLILCSFVAPHGVKVCGPVYLADLRYPHPNTIRQALHELFHPPYREHEVQAELAALAADPLVRTSFDAQDPVYRYQTMEGWIEENLVEAMTHLFAREAGFAADHDSNAHINLTTGAYKLGAVLLHHMRRLPKDPSEPFAAYFRRLRRRPARGPVGPDARRAPEGRVVP